MGEAVAGDEKKEACGKNADDGETGSGEDAGEKALVGGVDGLSHPLKMAEEAVEMRGRCF